MIFTDRKNPIPLYRQIYNCIVNEILSGSMPAGHRLPATRKLAEDLSVGRNTVDKAYHQLEAEGYINSRTGSGFTVCDIPIGFEGTNYEKTMTYAEKHTETSASNRNDDTSAIPKYDFVYGSMDNDVFPYKQWRRCMNDILTAMEVSENLHYPARMGEPELQRAIAGYLKRARNVSCDPGNILILPGQQHAMEILSNIFDGDSKVFAMEDPGYDGIRKVFEKNGFRIIPVKVDNDGVSMVYIKNITADLLYLTPSHQFPTGAVLPIGKRRQLLRWAAETGTYIIEDDYDSELRYYTSPIPAMQSLDTAGMTIYTGTFSKSLAPVMRTSYMILPDILKERYMERYGRYNAFVPVFHQKALAAFINEGFYEQHINRLRKIYRRKHAALLKAIDDAFGKDITILGGGAGIHILIKVKSNLTRKQMIEAAEKKGIRVYDTDILYSDPASCPEHQLLLGFPTVPTEAFESIFRTLREEWK